MESRLEIWGVLSGIRYYIFALVPLTVECDVSGVLCGHAVVFDPLVEGGGDVIIMV